MRFLFFALLLSGMLAGTPAIAQETTPEALRILRITPEGDDVPAARQIVIEFNRPVVAVGRMERDASEVPVTVSPAVNCQWRWLNTTSLSCNLNEKDELVPATSYEVTVNPGIKTLDGVTLSEAHQHRFIVERPDVKYTNLQTWLSPSTPVIRVQFNQYVAKAAAEPHVFFLDGTGARVSAVVEGVDQETDVKKLNGVEYRRTWLAKPARELPLDSPIAFNVEPGIASVAGTEKSVAERTLVKFDTHTAFAFLGVKCTTNEDKGILITSTPQQGPAGLCNPLGSFSLAFTAPVLRSNIKNGIVFTPGLTAPEKQAELWGDDENSDYSQLGSVHTSGRTYDIYLPGGLKAAQAYHMEAMGEGNIFQRAWRWVKRWWSKDAPTQIQDEFGRPLETPIDLTFTTDHRKPNFEITHATGVLEQGIDSDVPLYVNNLDSIGFNYSSITTDGINTGQRISQALVRVQDVQYKVPFGVRDMLKGKSGAIFGYVDPAPAVPNKSDYEYRMLAIVTPYQLHVKAGHFSTLVWVVDMATGLPVADADVSIFADELTDLTVDAPTLAHARTDASGVALLPGAATLDPALDLFRHYRDEQKRLFVRAEKGGELAVMPLMDDFQINTWRASGEKFEATNEARYGHMKAWGTTAQGVYRAGDTIQYKLYVRNQDDRSLVPPPREGYRLEIVDPMGNIVQTVPALTLSEFGAYDGEFTVSSQAPVGWYEFQLKADFGPKTEGDLANANPDAGLLSWNPLRVLVSDFTPSPFKVTVGLNGDLFQAGQKAEVTSNAELHSGGAYTDANARIVATLENKPFHSKNPIAQDFTFDTSNSEESSIEVHQEETALDEKGMLTTNFSLPEQPTILYGALTVESAVQDDRGKSVAARATADFVGVDRLVGLHSKEWIYDAGKPVSIDTLVVDERGIPAKGSKVSVAIEQQVTDAARVKGAGNAYVTNTTVEWKSAGNCAITSSDQPVPCSFTPTDAGSYRMVAKVEDSKGRAQSTTLNLWVTGNSNYVQWNDGNETLLDIMPEKTEYRVGDTARYMVKNPYPGAKALVTIERYGVVDRFVQTLEGSAPIVEFPVKEDYLPGFYLSVVVISPRVDKPVDKDQVDLGKPAFRMGYVSVPVIDPAKEMKVTATVAQEVYRPRDPVSVQLHAEPRLQSSRKEPIEFAVVVLDEAVFQLITAGKAYYDPYKGFYNLQDLDMRNYSLLTQLIGRQKFEKKGANPGGDGGADLSMRNLFKFVSYWNPSLKADINGNATINFEAPDNLTGWRVLALAVTPTDRLGLGEGNFKVNRPTEIRPVMPNQVLEKDTFQAGFSVMNRTDAARDITVTIEANGPVAGEKTHRETVSLAPYKRATVQFPITTRTLPADRDVSQEMLRFTARAEDATDSDAITHEVPVRKMRSLETAATYGTTAEAHTETPIAFPENIHTDVGNVELVASPSVIGNVEGAFKYMRDYPYMCWEQKLTKAVMASHYQSLKAYMSPTFSWPESKALPDETLKLAANFQAPNGGMGYFSAQDEYVDPYLSAYTALAFQWLRAAGHTIPETVETKLQHYLLTYLKQDVAPSFYDEGMNASVRAVALAALAESGKVTLSDIERYAPHLPQMGLFGKAHFALAATRVKGGEKYALQSAKAMLSSASESGGKFSFNETLDGSSARILATPLRENCAVLSSLVVLGKSESVKSLIGDKAFKLVRSITQSRGKRDHWENTQENMFCMNALADYAHAYEQVTPNMEITAALEGKPFGQAAFQSLTDQPVTLRRAIEETVPGKTETLSIDRAGEGRLYYSARLNYASREAPKNDINSGIEIHREYSVKRKGKWEMLTSQAKLARGEVVRVDLYVSLPTARNFVVVNDPIPGGLEPVNRDLATSSTVDANEGVFPAAEGAFWFRFDNWLDYGVSRWSFYHQELRHDAARFYSDYLPAGNYHLSYTAQAIADGEFAVMPALAEEMYDPDVFGKTTAQQLHVTTP